MKQSVTTSTTFKIVLVFTILFAGFLSLAIVYNKVYKLKNETVSIVEKYEGFSSTSVKIINNYLNNSNYLTKGSCHEGEYGVKDFSQTTLELADEDDQYYYCVSAHCAVRGCRIDDNSAGNGNKIYYDLRLFFKFNLPFIGDLLTFDITGETKGINLYDESQKLS